MPNWTFQQLHVVGSKAGIDSFIRTGFTRASVPGDDDELHFDRLCGTPAPKARGAELQDGVVLIYWRTSRQACFHLITAWDYPAWFYESLAAQYPSLSFCCVVSGEMGDFGGLVMSLEGEFVDQVYEFDGSYSRRAHLRAANKSMTRWMSFVTRGRDWRIMLLRPWEVGSLRADAHCDGDFWCYFASREAMSAFRRRYRCRYPQRRTDGEWKRTTCMRATA